MKNRYQNIFALIGVVLFFAACSTTKRLGDGDTLYTGVKKIEIESLTDHKVDGYVEEAAIDPLEIKPNNPLWSPYIRTPLPIGLWVYNNWYTEKEKGFKHWIYKQLAKKPVLVSDLKLDVRMKMVEDILDNHGHFNSTASYEIIPKRNPKKARLNYNIKVAEPWYYGDIAFPEEVCGLTRNICRLQESSLIESGEQYNIDTLESERIRITNYLRNKSYYYFRPDYIEYLADTTRNGHKVDLRMILKKGIPEAAKKPYKVGNINVQLYNAKNRGEADSIVYNGINVWYQKPLKLRARVLHRALTLKPGGESNVKDINETLTNLSKLGVFSYVNMEVTPLDSLKGSEYMDLTIKAAFDRPMEAELELDFSSKSNSFIGPGLAFGIKHKNIFKGGEVLSVKFNGSYEWQTGNTRSSANATSINSYEFGVNSSLAFSRLLLPRFMKPKNPRYDARTIYGLGANILNRPKFFRILELNLHTTYDFQTSRTSFHSLTPFRLVYNNLLSTTSHFRQMMENNRAIEKSFENQFIPSLSYTYTYNKKLGRGRRDNLIWQSTFTSAGNVFYGIYSMVGVKGEKKMFGSPFSQFIKGSTELKYFKQLGRTTTLAMRVLMGASHAYGNSSVVPYSEQFYIGGANSIRAFTIRSLGPGSYRPDENEVYGYFDQTGTFKFESNIEFRFGIMGGLKGAVFLDAGNIWLLREDEDRPGGKLEMKNLFKELATGTGFGLRYDLDFLVIRADFGIGLHTPYENPKKSGYYNLSKFKDGFGFHLAVGYPF